MVFFQNDYSCGAHPEVLRRLTELNLQPNVGYGEDPWTESAGRKIAEACQDPEADVYFLAGGTQANEVLIDMTCENYEGVICAETGHINVHEAGANEHNGHKILALPADADGKIYADQIRSWLEDFYSDETFEHMVQPGMVYVTHPTELGTLYSRKELEDIAGVCREYDLKLFVDGARLAYALAAPENDITLPDLARLTDIFYIGGTKCGTYIGEAAVFPKGAPKHAMNQIKMHGALLAKGFFCGIQFDALFTDGLYFKLGEEAIRHARTIIDAMRERGYGFPSVSPTNQIFAYTTNEKLAELRKHVACEASGKVDEDHTMFRLVTSWATTDEDVEKLISYL